MTVLFHNGFLLLFCLSPCRSAPVLIQWLPGKSTPFACKDTGRSPLPVGEPQVEFPQGWGGIVYKSIGSFGYYVGQNSI